jgi:two-component SAPR family response regulator
MVTKYLHIYRGKKLLIVATGPLLKEDVQVVLEAAGAILLGPVSRLSDLLLYLNTDRIDAAVVDIEFDDETLIELSEELDQRDVPFVFATHRSRHQSATAYSGYYLTTESAELAKIGVALFQETFQRRLH